MTLPVEILSVAEMAEADRITIANGISGHRLMEAAGAAVAEAAQRRLAGSGAGRVLVLCGPGNNGGDGFVAARRLREAGQAVTVATLGEAEAYRGDARAALDHWVAPICRTESLDLSDATIVIDAIFGAGLNRSVSGAAEALIERVNASGIPVLSVDVPSGIEGDSGRMLGRAIRATETVTFFRLKPAHWLLPGRQRCGVVTLADIGIGEAVLRNIGPAMVANLPEAWLRAFPDPSEAGHKYSRGHAVVVSGAMPTLGAARLAARGAARIGAGLVTVAAPKDALFAHAAQLTSIMLRESEGPEGLAQILSDGRKNVVVLGPGLGIGPATRRLVEAALAPAALAPATGTPGRAVVLDADALTSFAGDATSLARLVAQATGPVVVTPHDGEYLRLFGSDGDFGSPSKLVRARAGATLLGTILLLKGDDSVVATPNGRLSIAAARAPWLATAGSGDVLAGMIGGLLAQAMPPFEAVSAAVYLHAAAARRFGPGLISEDLPDGLPAVLRDILGGQMTSNHR